MSFVPDQPDDKQNGANPPGPAPDASPKPKWEPTPESFQQLLALFSPDYEEAGREYEKLRNKLIRYFEWRGCSPADMLADKTFDRAQEKIQEKIKKGETITNPKAYVRKVAYYIYLEHDPGLLTELDENNPPPAPVDRPDDDDKEKLFTCSDNCLAALSAESRRLIVAYYDNENQKNKDGRRELAEEVGIPMNALRIRAHRIRKSLEQCIRKCMAP
jgi:DNA-directed RNA polymerase specialized sigma24 family protein